MNSLFPCSGYAQEDEHGHGSFASLPTPSLQAAPREKSGASWLCKAEQCQHGHSSQEQTCCQAAPDRLLGVLEEFIKDSLPHGEKFQAVKPLRLGEAEGIHFFAEEFLTLHDNASQKQGHGTVNAETARPQEEVSRAGTHPESG